jgi:ATP synthase protein I
MGNSDQKSTEKEREKEFTETVKSKQERKIEARKDKGKEIWFGLGMFGTIGWAVSVPTLIGVAIGVWLDKRFPGSTISWTLIFLFVGVVLGCLNAWFWIERERTE